MYETNMGIQGGNLAGQGYGQAKLNPMQSEDQIKTSVIESALDRAHKMLEVCGHEVGLLRDRLSPISGASPQMAKAGGTLGDGRPISCKVEERISDLTERAVAIQAALRDMRESLCV